MNQDNEAQDILKTEEPAPPTDQPSNKNDKGDGQFQPVRRPRAETDQGPAQPMAHPPEDTFVGKGTHPQPGKPGR